MSIPDYTTKQREQLIQKFQDQIAGFQQQPDQQPVGTVYAVRSSRNPLRSAELARSVSEKHTGGVIRGL
jgi:hypothetical protein